MTDNVLDISTGKPLEKRRRAKLSRAERFLKEVLKDINGDKYVSVAIALIDENGDHITCHFVDPKHLAPMCVVLGNVADEMSDRALGFEDLDDLDESDYSD